MKPQIEYANNIITGRLIHIGEAQNGKRCNCICSECGKDVLAAQGQINEWHFRHVIETGCFGGLETIIHKLAKQIIFESNEIYSGSKLLSYKNPTKEQKFHTIIPDITFDVEGEKVFVEIEVTNPVDFNKESFYKKGNYKSIKIDLSDVPINISYKDLKRLVLRKAKREMIFWETINLPITNNLSDKKETPKPPLGLIDFFIENPIAALTALFFVAVAFIKLKNKLLYERF
ncbi:MAG: hypothetical protein JWN78_2481 [Bacteroidota bacterium]|nr:hypothetical protein [Bacteroidota bacterium]